MRLFFLALFFVTAMQLYAQDHFPIKVNRLWGLMDKSGTIVHKPQYDIIGEFNEYNYALVQDDGKVGLINGDGIIVFSPQFDDLKVLQTDLFIVEKEGERYIINRTKTKLLEGDFSEVEIAQNRFIFYTQNEKRACINFEGQKLLAPLYDDIFIYKNSYFQLEKGDSIGLATILGEVILEPIYKTFTIYKDQLFFYKKDRFWGAVDKKGTKVIDEKYNHYRPMFHYIKLIKNKFNVDLYDIKKEQIVNKNIYTDYQLLNEKLLLVTQNQKVGLMDLEGNEVLKPNYQQIQEFASEQFRVMKGGFWGLVKSGGEQIAPFSYDYISPLNERVSVFKKDPLYGILNIDGKEVVPAKFYKINLKKDKANAFLNEALEIILFDENGEIKEEDKIKKYAQIKLRKRNVRPVIRRSGGFAPDNIYVIGDYEWYYDAEIRKWGLKKLEDGSIQIKPVFDGVNIKRDLGLTVVFVDKISKYNFERTTYRFDRVYGVVNNKHGRMTTPVNMLDIQLEDFNRKELNVARIWTSDGRFGLMKKSGKIIAKGYAYIGTFNQGIARASKKGRLSGKMKQENIELGYLEHFLSRVDSPKDMEDFTKYDKRFKRKAQLYCSECLFGFIDTLAEEKIAFKYPYSEELTNGVIIVKNQNNKWGMIDEKGKELIPSEYQQVQFLARTDKNVVKLIRQEEKYGVIDTLGRLIAATMYDEIGTFAEGRLPVKRKGYWGFIDQNGKEVVPCRFKKIRPFSNGMAAVANGLKWGFIDLQGNQIIKTQYRHVGDFKEGLAWVATKIGVGFIDKKGVFTIPAQFNKAYDFNSDIARVKVGNKIGLIMRSGEFILSPKYRDISAFEKNDVAIVKTGGNKIRYILVNRRGERVGKHSFQKIFSFNEGIAKVKDNNLYGFVDVEGHLLLATDYDKVGDFSEGRAWVKKEGKCGYIDTTGEIIVPLEFNKCEDYQDGTALVFESPKKGGVLDREGDFILEPKLNKILAYSEDRGLMCDKRKRYYFISKSGDPYEGFYQDARPFKNKIAIVKIDGKWGIINTKGIPVVPTKYDKIGTFENGYAAIKISGFQGVTDLQGQTIVPAEYEYVSYAGNGLYRVEQGGKIGYFDTEGKWVWELKE